MFAGLRLVALMSSRKANKAGLASLILYLSQLIADCRDEKERNDIIEMMRNGSVMHWAHINLHGEFDFRQPAANEVHFDVQKILKLEIA